MATEDRANRTVLPADRRKVSVPGLLGGIYIVCNEPDAPEAEGRCAFPKTDRRCSTLPDSKQVDEGSMKRQQFLMRAMEPFAIAATLACAVTPDLHWSGVF